MRSSLGSTNGYHSGGKYGSGLHGGVGGGALFPQFPTTGLGSHEKQKDSNKSHEATLEEPNCVSSKYSRACEPPRYGYHGYYYNYPGFVVGTAIIGGPVLASALQPSRHVVHVRQKVQVESINPNANVRRHVIHIPDDIYPGETFRVVLDGEESIITCPDITGPGERVVVVVEQPPQEVIINDTVHKVQTGGSALNPVVLGSNSASSLPFPATPSVISNNSSSSNSMLSVAKVSYAPVVAPVAPVTTASSPISPATAECTAEYYATAAPAVVSAAAEEASSGLGVTTAIPVGSDGGGSIALSNDTEVTVPSGATPLGFIQAPSIAAVRMPSAPGPVVRQTTEDRTKDVISCPTCTVYNPVGARRCEVCLSPLVV